MVKSVEVILTVNLPVRVYVRSFLLWSSQINLLQLRTDFSLGLREEQLGAVSSTTDPQTLLSHTMIDTDVVPAVMTTSFWLFFPLLMLFLPLYVVCLFLSLIYFIVSLPADLTLL